VDLFEEIRREYEFGLASISGVARKFGVHRRMVREAIESSIPMRLPAKARPRPTIGPLAGFIDEILEDDRRAPRKQRHTAHRIWVRITRERSSHPIAESTVRQYVRQRKRTLGLRVVPEAFTGHQGHPALPGRSRPADARARRAAWRAGSESAGPRGLASRTSKPVGGSRSVRSWYYRQLTRSAVMLRACHVHWTRALRT
jgi:hypothetical protein